MDSICIPVALFLEPASPTGTALWISVKAAGVIHAATEESLLVRKLTSFCEGNFQNFMPSAIKRECGKTFGIHLRQYRLVGFFDQGYEVFIALDCFIKKTQRNDSRMNTIYQKVESIREAGTWEKVT